MPIKCWPASERPRERLLAKGVETLSDAGRGPLKLQPFGCILWLEVNQNEPNPSFILFHPKKEIFP